MDLFTDAVGYLGFDTYFRGEWFRQDWLPHQVQHNIQWKELYAIVVAAVTVLGAISGLAKKFCSTATTWQSSSHGPRDHPRIEL